MAQRSPPAALLELQQNFPLVSITPFDGDWTPFELRFTTAISRLPAIRSLVSRKLLRPTVELAKIKIFPSMNGNSQLSKFKSGLCAYSTGVVALSCNVNSQKYATCVSVGEYNNPWLGDTFDLTTSRAAYGAIMAAARAAHDGEDFEAAETFDQYLVREIGDRIAYERAQVLAIRQQEWDAANSFLFSALLGSVRDMDHAIIRAHQGDGASAWQALRAVFAGAASSRSGLISALDSLQRFQCPAADNCQERNEGPHGGVAPRGDIFSL